MSKEVHDMFARIARRYDLANDVLSMGIHRLWRLKAIEIAAIQEGETVLDLCTGTGDFAFALADTVTSTGRVIGLDFVLPMFSGAIEKVYARYPFKAGPVDPHAPSFIHGDAMELPCPSNSFDAVTISFGIRNVDSPLGCLQEIYRVLRPGGKAVILEFGQPTLPLFAPFFRWYSRYIMPLLGGILSGDRAAYEYLPRTSATFPAREAFLDLMRRAEFKSARFKALTGGIAYIYTAEKVS